MNIKLNNSFTEVDHKAKERAKKSPPTKVNSIRKLATIEKKDVIIITNQSFPLQFLNIIILLSLFYFLHQNRATLIGRLRQIYINQLNDYMFSDYCLIPLPTDVIVRALQSNVVGQDDVWQSLRPLLDHNDGRSVNASQSVTFVGGVGVGKTLGSSILQSQWPWQTNVIHLVWTADMTTKELLPIVQIRLINCGQNLIVIDNLKNNGGEHQINQMNAILLKEFEDKFNMFILYVLTVPTYSTKDLMEFDETIASAVANVETVVIPFRKIDEDMLRQCTRLAANRMMNNDVAPLDDGQINEALIGLDSLRSGCKHVSARVSLMLL